MVDPPPPTSNNVTGKSELRNRMRSLRREHVASLPDSTRALLFRRPPSPLVSLLPEGAPIGLYHARGAEAPTQAYANWLFEQGHPLALPWFESRDAPMRFRAWENPHVAETLTEGPYGVAQPHVDAELVIPRIAIVPVTAFTARCDRLGQGGGHYDRWLAENPDTVPIGLAWDCQLVDAFPVEPHDRSMDMIITPTRLFEKGQT